VSCPLENTVSLDYAWRNKRGEASKTKAPLFFHSGPTSREDNKVEKHIDKKACSMPLALWLAQAFKKGRTLSKQIQRLSVFRKTTVSSLKNEMQPLLTHLSFVVRAEPIWFSACAYMADFTLPVCCAAIPGSNIGALTHTTNKHAAGYWATLFGGIKSAKGTLAVPSAFRAWRVLASRTLVPSLWSSSCGGGGTAVHTQARGDERESAHCPCAAAVGASHLLLANSNH